MIYAWISRRIFGSRIPENKIIVEQIEKETERLNGAVANLTQETKIVKRHRVEMSQVLDDTLRAMKEHRG